MLSVVSPAKSLDFDSPGRSRKSTEPAFLEESSRLIADLKKLTPENLSELMNISSALADENFRRYANWQTPFDLNNAKQAIYAFNGDVYLGLKAERFGTADLNFAQRHLRILSGLYGMLRPLDLIQPYRLEMGRKFACNGSKNLYDFWGSKLTHAINEALSAQTQKRRVVINLASKEYFSAVQTPELDAEIITPVFKDFASGEYRVLSFFAKKARGEMAAFIIKNRINSAHRLKEFNVEGYQYCEHDSTSSTLVFKRRLSDQSSTD
jgi:cytoplasmic iron level regulating protein YaaA (DUF328/UPF0246 family)